MNYHERALSFSLRGDALFGIVSVPERPGRRGVLIVVGGPQYRAGSHRQFTLLARGLAAQGIAAMRFDYRGMGDSEGDKRDFEGIDDDLRISIDAFCDAVPGTEEVVVWGLCDAASAAMYYAAQDARIAGLVLLNPWSRTATGIAKTTLKHYYRARLLDAGLWRKILGGEFDYRGAGKSLLALLRASRGGAPGGDSDLGGAAAAPLPERMHAGLSKFGGKVLLILSGTDLTAQEFVDMTNASPAWRSLLAAPHMTHKRLAEADHTFSRRAWRDQVTAWTGDWIRSW